MVKKNESQLSISHIKPHKGVSSSTMSGWIKEAVGLAVFFTNIFEGQ